MKSGKAVRRNVLKLIAGLPVLASMGASNAAAPLLARRIPRTGESLPAVGLGTWQVFDVAGRKAQLDEAGDALRRFAELGGTLVDSSPMYRSSESVVGDLAAASGLHARLFLATKVWTQGRDAGIRQMEESIRRMRVPSGRALDLMQVHNLTDTQTHLATLAQWKSAGRVRYVGVTHYHEGAHNDLERMVRDGQLDFVQVNYSLSERNADRRLLGAAAEAGVAVIVNRPFEEGALFRRVSGKALPQWAAEFDCASWAQFFLKWILAHPAVTCVIPGTRNARHIADNMGAARGRLPDAAARRKMAALIDA